MVASRAIRGVCRNILTLLASLSGYLGVKARFLCGDLSIYARAASMYVWWEVKGVYAVVVSVEEGFDDFYLDGFFQDAFPELLIPRS